MDILVWLLVVNLLAIAAFVSFVVPRTHFATPWLGLATVVVGSWQAFSSSATLVAEGSIGAGLGWLVTAVYGLIGLGIVIGYIRLQPVPYVSLGTIVAGIIYVASFYAYLPPYSSSLSGMLVLAVPGLVFVAYGAALWYLHGLAPSMKSQNSGLRLALAMGIVAGFGAIGFLAYQSERNDLPSWAVRPLDLPRLATDSPLVAEGVVVEKESRTVDLQRSSGRNSRVYTLYKIEVSQFWRGEEIGTVSVAIPDFSPITLTPGQPYLVFFSGRADQEKFPRHWTLIDPQQVWAVHSGSFDTYAGITPAASITKQELTDMLAANPTNTSTTQVNSTEATGSDASSPDGEVVDASIGITLGRAVVQPSGRVTLFYVARDTTREVDGAIMIDSAEIAGSDGHSWPTDGHGAVLDRPPLTLGWLTFPVSDAAPGGFRVTANSVQANALRETGTWHLPRLPRPRGPEWCIRAYCHRLGTVC